MNSTGNDIIPNATVRTHADPRDEAWFASLYHRTFDTVYHLARTLVRDHDTAEDIVANTYMRVWQARLKYSGQGTLLSWVMAITRNCAMDHLRAHRPNVPLDLFDSIGDPEGHESPGPSITESDAEATRRAIAELSAEQQEVIFLRFYQELPHDAVAAKLGKSPTAIRQIQFRALVRLRQILQGELVTAKPISDGARASKSG
jgi:RNA polymerase sigma-70 factor (ECF subfamily)